MGQANMKKETSWSFQDGGKLATAESKGETKDW